MISPDGEGCEAADTNSPSSDTRQIN
jgi:hypothetical protein